jgi:hypothetical protein
MAHNKAKKSIHPEPASGPKLHKQSSKKANYSVGPAHLPQSKQKKGMKLG